MLNTYITVLASEILKERDCVMYIDNELNEIPCVVLYDLESKSNFEIISVDTIKVNTDGSRYGKSIATAYKLVV